MKKKDRISCVATGIQPYGVFIEYQDFTGLIHISEISDHYIDDIEEIIKVGDRIDVIVLDVDEKNKRLKLSYKQANPIHPKIKGMVKIKKGFHPLARALPHWIEKSKKK
jgi:general stress protein 13